MKSILKDVLNLEWVQRPQKSRDKEKWEDTLFFPSNEQMRLFLQKRTTCTSTYVERVSSSTVKVKKRQVLELRRTQTLNVNKLSRIINKRAIECRIDLLQFTFDSQPSFLILKRTKGARLWAIGIREAILNEQAIWVLSAWQHQKIYVALPVLWILNWIYNPK